MKRLVLTFALLIGLAAPAWAGFAEGLAAHERGDYATALRELRPLAEQGNADAQWSWVSSLRRLPLYISPVVRSPESLPMAAAESPSSLKRYLGPADITKLDWLLLQAQVSAFTTDIRWDDYGLVQSVSLYAINPPGLVGMVFLVNKERYIALPDDTAKKVFFDVVFQAANILAHTIPEVKGGANVYANFTVAVGDIVAEYKHGQVSLRR